MEDNLQILGHISIRCAAINDGANSEVSVLWKATHRLLLSADFEGMGIRNEELATVMYIITGMKV